MVKNPRRHPVVSTTRDNHHEELASLKQLQSKHASRYPRLHEVLVWVLSFGVAVTVFSLASAAHAAAATTTNDDSSKNYHWDLLNGSVTLTEPIQLKFRDRSTGTERSVTLIKPQIVGAGSGGAVFAFDHDDRPPQQEATTTTTTTTTIRSAVDTGPPFQEQDLLLKISWEGTSKTVQRECATLQLLEDRKVHAAERCLGTFDYHSRGNKKGEEEDSAPRTMILVGPYVRDAVASLAEIENEAARIAAVDQIARTLVQMLAANVITIDVQPLISKTTGRTIFIDMTEAQVLSSKVGSEYSFLDQTLISSFTSEMVALVPEDYWKVAKKSILDELQQMKNRGTAISQQARSVLEEQTPFLLDD